MSKAKIIYVFGILAMKQTARALTSIDLFGCAVELTRFLLLQLVKRFAFRAYARLSLDDIVNFKEFGLSRVNA